MFQDKIKFKQRVMSRVMSRVRKKEMKAMLLKILSFFCLLLLLLFLVVTPARSDDCVYTVYVRTGKIIKGGTDSIIGLHLYDSYGYGIYIRDLESWGGLMDSGHDYYERGNLDIFSGRGPCLKGPVCKMNLTSDGSGAHHGWYCNYVEVTSTGPHIHCAQRLFTVDQWLALDTSPYRLWAHRDLCIPSISHPPGSSYIPTYTSLA